MPEQDATTPDDKMNPIRNCEDRHAGVRRRRVVVSVASVVIAPPRAETRGDADASLSDLLVSFVRRAFWDVRLCSLSLLSERVSSSPDEKQNYP